jgi:hypothetical protein
VRSATISSLSLPRHPICSPYTLLEPIGIPIGLPHIIYIQGTQLFLSVLVHMTAWQDCQKHLVACCRFPPFNPILHLLNYPQSPKLIMHPSSSIFVNSVPRFKSSFSYPSHKSRPQSPTLGASPAGTAWRISSSRISGCRRLVRNGWDTQARIEILKE